MTTPRCALGPPLFTFVFVALASPLAGCGEDAAGSDAGTASGSDGSTASADASSTSTVDAGVTVTADDHEEDSDYVWEASDEVLISLLHTSIETDLTRASVDGTTVTVTTPGTYRVVGTLDDGQLVVDTDGLVRLILDDASITCSDGAAIDVESAEKAIVILDAGSTNHLADGASYVLPEGEDEPNAALYSRADLTLYGLGGTLTVDASYADGVRSKDGLVVRDANVTVTAVDDGLVGKDYLVVQSGSLTVTAGGDALGSDNEEDPSLGRVTIGGGTFDLDSGDDGIAGFTRVDISGGTFAITTGGGSAGTVAEDATAKGIVAGTLVTIAGGTFTIDAADDAVHSDTNAVLSGGALTLASGDQGIKVGDTGALAITGGTIDITRSTEGLSGGAITIAGGAIHIVASDDGLSVSHGTDAMSEDDGSTLAITGGYLVVSSTGDGIDVNGSGTMTGGTVLVNGPTENSNAALDHNGAFDVSGGLLVAVGSSGMAQTASESSTQRSLLVALTSQVSAGTLLHLQDASGADLLTFAPAKSCQSLAFTSPALTAGQSLSLYTGGTYSGGTVTDGLHTGGTYAPGTLAQSFTTSTTSTVTTSGTTSGGGGGGGGGRG